MKALFFVAVLFQIVSFCIASGVLSQTLEYDTDRPGMDYKNFDLPSPDPNRCQNACINDPNCKAFTYVKPGIQGAKARCWLKTGVPAPRQSTCCISGIKKADAGAPVQPGLSSVTPAASFESDTDRPGMDYRSFNLPDPRPELCRQTCMQEHQCKSFTYVKPGIQGLSARCWLKSGVPAPMKSSCCISGVKTSKEEATAKPIPVPSPSPSDSLTVPAPASLTQPDAKLLSTLISGSQRLQSFQVAASNRLKDLNLRERQLEDDKIQKVMQEIMILTASGSQPQKKQGAATQACSTPQIHSVYPISVKPGYPLLIQGCGFPAYPKMIMYDPKGDALGSISSMPNTVELYAEKSSGTSIQVTVPRVQYGGLLPLKEPKEVFIRIWDSSTKQYGPPSPKINLGFNTNVYLCRQNECFPKKIAKNGTHVLVQHGANQCTSQVFHMTDFTEQTTPEKLPKIGGGWNHWDMKGTDVIVENLNLPVWFKFTEFLFSYDLFCYDKKATTYQPCGSSPTTGLGAGNSIARIEQDISKIDGQMSLPKASVYWQTRGGISFHDRAWQKTDDVWVAYWYAIYIRGPEGWASIPF